MANFDLRHYNIVLEGGVSMGLPDWEAFLENHIEGFFNRKFSSELAPVEVRKA